MCGDNFISGRSVAQGGGRECVQINGVKISPAAPLPFSFILKNIFGGAKKSNVSRIFAITHISTLTGESWHERYYDEGTKGKQGKATAARRSTTARVPR